MFLLDNLLLSHSKGKLLDYDKTSRRMRVASAVSSTLVRRCCADRDIYIPPIWVRHAVEPMLTSAPLTGQLVVHVVLSD